MEKRLILAVALMIAVAVLPSLLFSPPPAPPGLADTTPVPVDRARVTQESMPAPPRRPAAQEKLPSIGGAPNVPSSEPEGEIIVVSSPLYRYHLSTAGGRLTQAWIRNYPSLAPTDTGSVQLVRADAPLLVQGLVLGTDTLHFGAHRFATTRTRVDLDGRPEEVTMEGSADNLQIRLSYRFLPDTYRFEVRGEIIGLPPTGAVLTLGLGAGLRSAEADTVGDHRSYAVVTKARSTASIGFGKVQQAEVDTLAGPFSWVATKSKYFVGAVFADREQGAPFGGVLVAGGVRDDKVASRLDAVATLPVSQRGTFGYDVYIGPQEHRRLKAIGDQFEDVNPYGWFLRPVIRPIAGVVVSILVWLHERLSLAYGWVLILFGLSIRVLLWPLNQKAMESSARMQAVAPLMKELQERYKNEPQRLQQEMMKLYKEHNVNPLGGCLPMLLPMPVLFALFFVFNNTIQFRGVPFLWLPDLSRADPLYVIPVVMGLSMFALMWIGQRGTPANPQSKMMLYFMPGMMTVLFLRFSSGLNLYYAATNIFSLPQQWLIARRRVATQGALARK